MGTAGLLPSMLWNRRQDGLSLREIGKEFGISGERVRQVLKREHGCTTILYWKGTGQAAKLLGCHRRTLCRIITRNRLAISKRGGAYRWSAEDIEAVKAILQRYCAVCGLLTRNPKYCSIDCRKEGQAYRNRSPEAKARADVSSSKWRQTHLERIRAINRRASRRYQAKIKGVS